MLGWFLGIRLVVMGSGSIIGWARFWVEVGGVHVSRSLASSWVLFFLFFLACSAVVAGPLRTASLAAVVLLGVRSLAELGVSIVGS